MKRILSAAAVLLLFISRAMADTEVPSMREALQTATATEQPAAGAFRFRDGVTWGMSTAQVQMTEHEKMTERTLNDWAIMVTDGKTQVSRCRADLIYMFYHDRLLMITYEFQQTDNGGDYEYLTGALSTVYGEKKSPDAAAIKFIMDRVYPNRYKTEWIMKPWVWTAQDGTFVYLYYYAENAFAIMYVCPELIQGGYGVYQTEGL